MKIDVSKTETFKHIMKDISRGSVFFDSQELDLPSAKLLDIVHESDLPGLSIHILIKRPAGESLTPCYRRPGSANPFQPPRGVSGIHMYL